VGVADGFHVEAFGVGHERTNFSCGRDSLDKYFSRQLEDDVRARLARAFVLVGSVPSQPVGFYTLSNASMDLFLLPEKDKEGIRRYDYVPATLLGRFAVDTRFQKQDLGAFLLTDALKRSWLAARNVASWCVVVHTREQGARDFYVHYNFAVLPEARSRLYIPMAALDELFSAE
jgi:GNAT superfamily N-acetyltransferase